MRGERMSKTAWPKLAPIAALAPAFSNIKPTKAVTVDLPLEPVIPTTRALPLTSLAKSSISPTISTPASWAALIAGKLMDRPGLTTNMS